MINVLINAYACSPNWGSEPGMGWNWVTHLALYCNVFVITEGEWRKEIDEAVDKLPQKDSLHFFYLPVAEEVRKMCWDQGDWRFYYHYAKWQQRALSLAREIIAQHSIQVIHQLNMVGFREPGYLWKITGLPYVWGPTTGENSIPMRYMTGAGVKMYILSAVKNILNFLEFRYHPRVSAAMHRADAMIAATAATQERIKRIYHKEAYLIQETGTEGSDKVSEDRRPQEELDILWVGRFLYTKRLDIALKSVAAMSNNGCVRLHIVGFGNHEAELHYQQMASELGIEQRCVWHGKINHQSVLALMKECNLLFFTSVVEATSTVVLEALQNELPVVCHDICGFGPLIDERTGFKIPLSSPKKSVREFADILNRIVENPGLLSLDTSGFAEKIEMLSWNHKAEEVVGIYTKIIGHEGIQ
jgi:glycosyltransferase involved in cell wall biosynthesis